MQPSIWFSCVLTIVFIILQLTIGNIEAIPIESASKKDYYMTRGWGEPSLPFSVIYSNYGRTKLQQELANRSTTTSSTTVPTPRKYSNAKTKTYGLTQIFASKGWGPMGK